MNRETSHARQGSFLFIRGIGRIGLVGLLVVLAGCNGAIIDNRSGPGGDGGLVDDDGSATDLVGQTCDPPCALHQICHFTGVCIEPGSCVLDSDCTPPEVCDPSAKVCVINEECGAMKVNAEVVPPNLLVVLDRSCSMKGEVNGTSKWQISVDALNKLIGNNTDQIRFGLVLFPDTEGEKCTQEQYPVPLGAGNETAITTLLNKALKVANKYFPDGPCVTNIDTAMQQAAADPALKDASRENYVLLITDGKQAGCSEAGGDQGTTQIIKQLHNKKSVATFVVGFGNKVDPDQLNIFADAGGKPNNDPLTRFYKAEDQTSLDQALAAIAKKAMGCVLELEQVPPDLDKIVVFFDGQPVSKDASHVNGWDYDPATNQVTVYGPACQDLQSGAVQKVDIVYSCRKPTDNVVCKPEETSCKDQDECPQDQMCLAGCCTKVLE